MMQIFLLMVSVASWSGVNCECFSATHALAKLTGDEKAILIEWMTYANLTKNDFVKRKLKIWQNEHDLIERDVVRYIGNPLNAFLLIKRTIADVETVVKYLPAAEAEEMAAKIVKIQPSDGDLLGAIEGLLRLQEVYKLSSEDLANGIINGKETRSPLTAHDLFVIGEIAASIEGQDYFVQEYLNLALKRITDGLDVDNEVDLKVLLNLLISSYTRTGNYDKAVDTVDELILIDPKSKDYVEFKQKLLNDQLDTASNHLIQDDPYEDDYIRDGSYTTEKQKILLSKSCRGVNTKDLAEQSKLRCRFVSNNAFSRLARFKAEEANLDPYIVLFHDVISDNEINFMKIISEPKIERAKVLEKNVSFATNERIAQFTWHDDNSHEMFSKLSRRVEDMTGLSQKSAESLQAQNYGIGGHYHIHWDFMQEGDVDVNIGNRIATVLFFLSDVEEGGATIFPFLKVRVPPQKGTAIFWYNLRSSGERDRRTLHMGCPVLLGSKWVMNRWIHEYHNEFRRPCEVEEFVETPEDAYYKGFF